jgi:Asp-tRNA(Asn)/Glu-tRNA(Gln) amidotransferase A subunit family amidase
VRDSLESLKTHEAQMGEVDVRVVTQDEAERVISLLSALEPHNSEARVSVEGWSGRRWSEPKRSRGSSPEPAAWPMRSASNSKRGWKRISELTGTERHTVNSVSRERKAGRL